MTWHDQDWSGGQEEAWTAAWGGTEKQALQGLWGRVEGWAGKRRFLLRQQVLRSGGRQGWQI